MLPPPSGTKEKSKSSFNHCVDKFVYFAGETHPTEWAFADPIIVITGKSKENIEQFYITIDKQVLAIPSHYKFYNVFDIYFKLHHIFNISYCNELKSFLTFFEKYLYKFPNKTATPRIFEIWNALQNVNKNKTLV